jgi:hypothetical protein
MNRTQKDLDELVRDTTQEAMKLGQVMMNLGTSAGHIPIAAKMAASDMCMQAENLRKIATELTVIANRVIDWEMAAIKHHQPQGLVDVDGNPIGG